MKFPFIYAIYSTGIFLITAQFRNSNSASYSYNFYFYLCIKFYLSYFTFYNEWISKFLHLRQLNMSLIHIKLPANLACFRKSHISPNCLKLEFLLPPSLYLDLLIHSFFIYIHVQNLCSTVQTSCLCFRHSYWDIHKLVYNLQTQINEDLRSLKYTFNTYI